MQPNLIDKFYVQALHDFSNGINMQKMLTIVIIPQTAKQLLSRDADIQDDVITNAARNTWNEWRAVYLD